MLRKSCSERALPLSHIKHIPNPTIQHHHSPVFKARVAIEASSGRKTIQEIAAEHAMNWLKAAHLAVRPAPGQSVEAAAARSRPSRAQRLPALCAPSSGGFCFVALETALASGRKPELFHVDQGCQFT